MTQKSKSRTTRTARKTSPPESTLTDLPLNWDLSPTTTPAFELPWRIGVYEQIGFCGICFMRIAAIQPGGLLPKHQHDGSPICSTKGVK